MEKVFHPIKQTLKIKGLLSLILLWNKEVSMVDIITHILMADPLTKGLPPKQFKEHVTSVGIIESFDVLG